MAPLSEDEENFVRLALLLKGVTPKAVRTYFDSEFPPTSLTSTLHTNKTNYNTLFDLKLKRIINQAQWNLLNPKNGVPDSKTFDVTLMICVIRNLASINPPINGFESLPLPGETTPASDLARIKCYRNKLAHHDSSTIDLAFFNTAWRDISDAVGRLGGQTLYQECQELKVEILDQSNQEIILEIKKSLEELKELRQKMDNFGTELSKVKEILKDPIPPNIKDQIKKEIDDWEKKDKMFVSTRASDYVMECLKNNSCLTLTAPSGVGKSFISRHTALVLQKKGYQIIPVYSPADIRYFYQPGKQTVFILDDICGNYTANQRQIENWKQLLPVVNTIIADNCKIIVSCRLQVYKDEKFNILSPFKSCECNLVSYELGLTFEEKTKIADTYIGTSCTDIAYLSQNCVFFPLLCSLYYEQKHADVKEFFKNPFDVYKSELDRLSEHGDEGNYKLCSLALCVLFNNRLKEKWFEGKVTDEQRCIIKDTCDACNINSVPKTKLKKALDTLDGTFICKQYGIYRTIHDKLFDFLAHYFGQKITECLVDHGDSDLIHERFIWQKSADDKTSSIHFIIKIPDDYLESYLQRLIKDWSTGKVVNVFNNTNMQVSSFREKLLEHLKQLDKSIQVSLVNTKDIERHKASCESGNTPLIMTCYDGYTDMVQWIIDNAVDVDQCRDDGETGLHIASQEGHTDIVKLLLKKNPIVDLYNKNGCTPLLLASHNGHTDIVKLLLQKSLYVDLCDKNGRSSLLLASQNGHTDILKLLLDWNSNINLCDNNGCSSLLLASQNGHTDIVKLLLENDPNVDLCNNNGRSPLIQATQKGHTDIVKILLERNADVDLCDNDGFTPLILSSISNDISTVQLLMKHKPNINAQTYDGGNALYFSALHINIAITLLLLDNNADCNICIHSKQCITDQFGHRSQILEKEKRGLFDSLVKNTSSHITDYVSKKPEDYSFGVVAGSSLLHIACFMGRINVVRCLLDYNANINMTKEDGTTPLFYACEIGHKEIVCLLLDKGADTQICRLDWKSPLQIAIDNGHTSIIMIVTEHIKKEEQLPF